jgi:peptide/nickel transport system permease protein
MTGFVARRLGFLVLVLLGVSLITFGIAHLAPGDPARLIAGGQASAQTVEKVRRHLGLDQPLWRQYLIYLDQLAHLDLGVSNASGRPVLKEIGQRAPASIELLGGGLLVATLIGVPMGVWAALNQRRGPDYAVRAASILGAAAPAFWVGLVLIVIFYRNLFWFPAGGRFTGTPPSAVTGLMTVDSLIAGDFVALRTSLAHLALPVLSIALLDVGILARLTRNQLLGVMNQEYVRVAQASGLPRAEAVRRHALRNALSPLVTVLAASIAGMLYGSVSVETVFGWPGAGKYMVDAVFNLDFPVIMGFAVLTAVAYVVLNTLADLVYAALDPRVRLS